MAKAESVPSAIRPPITGARQQNPSPMRCFAHRRHFIGGSDAREIMGGDEEALLRLWQEKRGEVEPEDLSGNLIVQLGPRNGGPESALVRGQYRPGHHGYPEKGPAPRPAVDGSDARRAGSGQ